MLSPNNGRPSGANKVGLLIADSLTRHLLQCAWDSSVFAMDRTYVIELVKIYDASLGPKRHKITMTEI